VGQALAELALMLPLMLILVVGVIEVNSAMNAYITVVNSARDGARLGSKGGATTGDIQALVVKDLERLPQNASTSDVTVTFPTVSGTTSVKVQSCYDHQTLLQVPLLMSGTFRMCSQTTMPKLN
jgi:Flp pilus assembly protein TadG